VYRNATAGLRERYGERSLLEEFVINIAPAPIFAALERLNDRMLGGVIVFGGVLTFGLVTAADMPARQTHSQMDPGITELETLFTTACIGLDVTNLVQMSAYEIVHGIVLDRDTPIVPLNHVIVKSKNKKRSRANSRGFFLISGH